MKNVEARIAIMEPALVKLIEGQQTLGRYMEDLMKEKGGPPALQNTSPKPPGPPGMVDQLAAFAQAVDPLISVGQKLLGGGAGMGSDELYRTIGKSVFDGVIDTTVKGITRGLGKETASHVIATH